MTPDEKTKYMMMAFRMAGFQMSCYSAEVIVAVVEAVNDKKGDFTLDDFHYIETLCVARDKERSNAGEQSTGENH
jgi:hypothetical protein